jgi:predicted AlkP superfamily phosphohydrolase/phosphomutase
MVRQYRMNNRVLIIGIDGATFDIIKPLVSEGRLPTFKQLVEGGTHGILKSTAPAMTAPAWTTFMTGKNPGKHGLYHFISFDKGSYDYSVVNAAKCRSKTVFRLAAEAGKRIISINVPVTYPPEELNGIVISGMLSPKGKTFTHPAGLTQELLAEGYRIDVLDLEGAIGDKYFDAVIDMTDKRFEITARLLTRESWDLSMVAVVGADRLQHHFWDRKDLLEKYYVHLDGLIGRLLSLVGDSTYVMLMSDHGFTSIKGGFCVNQWLAEAGELKIDRFAPTLPGTFHDLLGHRHRGRYGRMKFIVHNLLASVTRGKLLSYPEISINFAKSAAFARPGETIFINRRSRFPNGMVEDGEDYETHRRIITEGLRELRDPVTGETVIGAVFQKEDIYSGECFDDAPDIIMLPKDNGYSFLGLRRSTSCIVRSPDLRSFHSTDGIFCLKGPDINAGMQTETLSIADCMPTILHLLGAEIPEDVDGRVLCEAFQKGSALATREPVFRGSSQKKESGAYESSDEDRRSVEDKLRGLGYLT